MIKILDSTLRDGGYVIDWDFGKNKIKSIVKNLVLSNIDLIELGFLSNKKTTNNKTIFNKIKEADNLIEGFSKDKFCLMVKSEDFDIESLKNPDKDSINKIRYIFKKHQIQTALKDCKAIIDKGFNLFINPVFIDEYKKCEYFDLIKKLNALNPYAISVVDSMGTMKEKEIVSLFLKLDNMLNKNTALCFHCHNNTEHAYINAKAIMDTNIQREIIVDSCVCGMGRGAGNLCTELSIQYLNQYHNKKYNLKAIIKTIEKDINPIYEKKPWGNCPPYFICALNHCHSGYADYLIKKKIKIEDMEKIFHLIPKENKTIFNLELIENIVSKTNTQQQKQLL